MTLSEEKGYPDIAFLHESINGGNYAGIPTLGF
jgi:hypothetical protein